MPVCLSAAARFETAGGGSDAEQFARKHWEIEWGTFRRNSSTSESDWTGSDKCSQSKLVHALFSKITASPTSRPGERKQVLPGHLAHLDGSLICLRMRAQLHDVRCETELGERSKNEDISIQRSYSWIHRTMIERTILYRRNTIALLSTMSAGSLRPRPMVI